MNKTIIKVFFQLVLVGILVLILAGFGLFAGTPKNIILMISDGCGYNHVDAASYFQYGEKGTQIYEKFPVRLAMSAYSASGEKYDPNRAWESFDFLKNKPTDSAASSTAISTGTKTYNGAIGVDVNKDTLENIVERLEKLGKSTGVITSVQFSHATPAGFVAHNESRHNYLEISCDMILTSQLEVIMGCGHPGYDDNGNLRNFSEWDYKYAGGSDIWEALLEGKAGSDADNDGVVDPWQLIESREDFMSLASGKTPKRVIGVPRVAKTLQQNRDGDKKAAPFETPQIQTVPTLPEMTAAALNVLDNNADGFFLMIEGGAVDWAAHDNNSGRVIEEQIDFNHAVEKVVEWVDEFSSWDETLLIVTSDHETGYLTGPESGHKSGFDPENNRPVWNPIKNNGKGNMPSMEWHSKKHTNSLIPFFSKGAGSDVFLRYADEEDIIRGKYIDNTEIARVLFSFFPLGKDFSTDKKTGTFTY